MSEIFDGILIGASVAFSIKNLVYCLIGVVLGTFVGVIPGIGALAAISMLFPLTFYLEPTTALIMLAGIWYGTTYGGSTSSILLNLPGTPSNAVACLDGYPMAQQGRAGVALFMTTFASFFGGSLGILVLMLFSPAIVSVALEFGVAEYFSLMLLGLVAASVIADASPVKGMAMIVFGILLGVIGLDMYTGAQRFTFGTLTLMEGVSLVALAMGLFGVAEVISSIRAISSNPVEKNITLRSLVPTRDDMRRSWMPMLRGAGIGSFFGALPGTGGTIASFMSYGVEKRIARDPSRFGKGAIEGVTGPESSNNAADQTAFIPTLTLGIPGTATMALMLGVLMIHGITPGPTMMTARPDVFWGLVVSFWIGNVLLVILNMPLIGIWVRIVTIPYHYLYPAVLTFVCIGVYTVSYNPYDVLMVVVFGIIGYVMRLLEFPAAPLLLGFVLGPRLEEQFRRAMVFSRGSPDIFFNRPISAFFLALTFALLAWGTYKAIRNWRNRRSQPFIAEGG